MKTHQECKDCGSSDALAEYENNTYCYSCATHRFKPNANRAKVSIDTIEDAESLTQDHASKNLLDIEVIDIASRKISARICDIYGYGVAKVADKTVQVANYCNMNGEVISQKVRTKDKGFWINGRNPKKYLFGQHLFQKKEEVLVITEGEIDALSVSEAFGGKIAVVSIPEGCKSVDSSFRANLEWILKHDKIILWLDNDEPGIAAAKVASKIIKSDKLFTVIHTPGYKDASDILTKLGSVEVIDMINRAELYRAPEIVTGNTWLDHITKEIPEGITIAEFPKISSMLNGFRTGEFTIITAGTGVGKSTLMLELASSILNNTNHRVGYFGLEETVQQLGIRFISIAENKKYLTNWNVVPNELKISLAKKHLIDKPLVVFDHLASMQIDEFLDSLETLIIRESLEYVFIDHLSILISGLAIEDERKAIDKLCTTLVKICVNTGTAIIAINHLSASSSTKSHEEGGRVTADQLRGSRALKQLSFNIIAGERNTQADSDNKHLSTWRILKCRITGNTGVADTCRYDPETGRMKAIDMKAGNITHTAAIVDEFNGGEDF